VSFCGEDVLFLQFCRTSVDFALLHHVLAGVLVHYSKRLAIILSLSGQKMGCGKRDRKTLTRTMDFKQPAMLLDQLDLGPSKAPRTCDRCVC
jgi:hypothetical protein